MIPFRTDLQAGICTKQKCQENLAGLPTDETNPGFIIPDLLQHLLCTKIQNEFVAVNMIFKKGGREKCGLF